MVAMESMACGTPVVAFAAGGLADALGNNEGGLLVPPGDVEQLAAAVRQILDDPELQTRLGRIGAERAAQDFSLAAHSQRCLDVYHRLLAERRPNN
jgi:glycosyltransferase involved in cell wall biosynthesis